LVGAWAFNEGGGLPLNLLNNVKISASDPSIISFNATNAAKFTIPYNGYVQGNIISYPVNSLTIVNILKIVSQSASSFLSGRFQIGASAGYDWGLYRSYSSSKISFFGKSGTSIAETSTTGLGTENIFIATYDGANIILCKNGVVQGTAAMSGSLSSSYNFNLAGCWASSTITEISRLQLLYNIALTNIQRVSLSVNPWQIFEPKTVWAYIADAGGGTPGTTTPSGVQATASIGTPIATGKGKISVTGVQSSSSVGSVSPTGKGKILITGQGCLASVGTAVASHVGAGIASPTGVSTTAAIGTAIPKGKGKILVSGDGTLASIGTAAASHAGGGTAHPSGLVVSSSVGTITATGKGKIVVTGQGCISSIGAASASHAGQGIATPAGVSSPSSIGTSTAKGKGNILVSGLLARISIGSCFNSPLPVYILASNRNDIFTTNKTAGIIYTSNIIQ
jgi:hypothetical protein